MVMVIVGIASVSERETEQVQSARPDECIGTGDAIFGENPRGPKEPCFISIRCMLPSTTIEARPDCDQWCIKSSGWRIGETVS